MAFLDSLREYLEGIRHPPTRAGGAALPAIDPANIRAQLITSVERCELEDRKSGKSFAPSYYRNLLDRWQSEDRVIRFAQRLGQLLLEGMSKGVSNAELESQIAVAIARQLGLPDSLPSLVRTLELERVAKVAYDDSAAVIREANSTAYAAAIRATRGTGASVSLTPIGRVFLEFTGRDAIRWLLHVEVAQSTGRNDIWRLSRETARALVKTTTWHFSDYDDFDAPPGAWATLRRLDDLEIVSITDENYGIKSRLEVLPLGQALLREVETETESPLSILVSSLLSDLELSAAKVAASPAVEEVGARASAAEATARQARLVAHEIRNALVPVKTSLSALYREVLLSPANEVLTRRRESIDRGIEAAFRFVDQVVKLSALAAKPPEPFDPLAVIRDAVVLVETESGKRVEQSLPTALPPVSGHRERVVMAITNVLRNATQAVSDAQAVIRIGAESVDGGRAVLLTIEDNGPGVPENMRQAIFDEGFSLRPGGSGMGLTLVREVFEKEMKGLVDCSASSLGGARFVIRMPVAGVE